MPTTPLRLALVPDQELHTAEGPANTHSDLPSLLPANTPDAQFKYVVEVLRSLKSSKGLTKDTRFVCDLMVDLADTCCSSPRRRGPKARKKLAPVAVEDVDVGAA